MKFYKKRQEDESNDAKFMNENESKEVETIFGHFLEWYTCDGWRAEQFDRK